MAVTLIVNPGSTSRKYALYRDGVLAARVTIEQAPDGVAACTVLTEGGEVCVPWAHGALTETLQPALAHMVTAGVIGSLGEITAVGVRVVAPGDQFAQHALLTPEYLEALSAVAPLIPVHVPLTLAACAEIAEVLSGVPVVAVSDSAFHQTQPAAYTTVALGDQQYRCSGYHGLSFASVAAQLPTLTGGVPERVVALHVGGGVSVAALRDGQSIATSMGYTPASGVMMGTRGGDVPADVLAVHMERKKLSPEAALYELYTAGGFSASAGVSDLRLLLDRAASGDEAAVRTVTRFVDQVDAWVAGHVMRLGGLDAIVLTATAVLRNPQLRAQLMAPLTPFGVVIDTEKNESLVGKAGVISTPESVPVYVMKTDEMGMMAAAVKTIVS